MSESLAQSLADSYWPEVRKWALSHAKGRFWTSGDVYMWIEIDAERAGAPQSGVWCVHDVTERAIEILKERVKAERAKI